MFPTTSVFLVLGREKSVSSLQVAQESDGKIVVVGQKKEEEHSNAPEIDNLYTMGTLCQIKNVAGSSKSGYQVLVTGISRFQTTNIKKVKDHFVCTGFSKPDVLDESIESIALLKNLKVLAKEILILLPGTEDTLKQLIDQIDQMDEITYLGAAYLKLNVEQMQNLLEEDDFNEKIKTLLALFSKEKEVLLLEKDIREKIGKKLTEEQRKALLREQLSAIKKELGQTEEDLSDDYFNQIEAAKMPLAIEKIAKQETHKLSILNSGSSDYQVLRNYLDTLCQMPWSKSTEDHLDLSRCKDILEKNHLGLKKIKKRILEHLAVSKLKKNMKGPILCLYGPPGVGKTSLGKSIADSLGRKFVQVSLGGVRDESEIRGHRRTYVGAMPGRIIQSIKRVEVNNPLILLDEIDKLGTGIQGDPSSAMLEVLDPEQNSNFMDHYLDVPFDLSNIFFMATANQLDTIPAPLRDRMELIELSSYTTDEKIKIGSKFILPQVIKENGLSEENIILENKEIRLLIEHYTREPGVRELKRMLSSICRAAALEISTSTKTKLIINSKKIKKYLGNHKYSSSQKLRNWTPGLVTGLAWTPVGGDILYLECLKLPGTGKLKMTGQLGAVMKESAEIAISYAHSCLKFIKPNFDYEKYDFHLHVPAGAIPKDGPSAGLAIVTAISSLIINEKVDQNLAMTGEITLSGSILPVGGIKEKLIAANRYKIKTVILPRQNKKDIEEVPEEILNELNLVFVDTIRGVLERLFQVKLNYKDSLFKKEAKHADQRLN